MNIEQLITAGIREAYERGKRDALAAVRAETIDPVPGFEYVFAHRDALGDYLRNGWVPVKKHGGARPPGRPMLARTLAYLRRGKYDDCNTNASLLKCGYLKRTGRARYALTARGRAAVASRAR